MAWVSFSESDVQAGMSARELETYQAAAERTSADIGGETHDQLLPAVVSRVRDMFRGAIRGNPQLVKMGPPGTLPDFCISWAVAICRANILGLNPVAEGETNPRRDEYNDAIKGRDSLRTMHPNAFLDTDPVGESSNAVLYGGDKLLKF